MLVVIVLTCIRYYEILVLIVSTNLFGFTNINFHLSSTVYLHVYNSAPDRTPGNTNRTYIVVSLLLGTVQSFWIGNTLVVQDESNSQLKLKNKKCLVYWVNLQYLLKTYICWECSLMACCIEKFQILSSFFLWVAIKILAHWLIPVHIQYFYLKVHCNMQYNQPQYTYFENS